MGFICQHTRRMILVNFGLVFGFPVWQNVNHLLFLLIFYSKRVQRLTTTCVRSPQSTDILYSFQYHNHLAIAPPVLVYDCFTSKFVLGKLRQPSSCLNFIYQQFFPRTLAHNLPRTSSSSPHEMFAYVIGCPRQHLSWISQPMQGVTNVTALQPLVWRMARLV